VLARHRRILKQERWYYRDKCSSAILDVETNRKLGWVASSFTLQNTPALQVSTSLSIWFSLNLSRPNWSFKMLFFKERRKLEKAKKKLSEQGRGLTSISTHKLCRFWDSVTGHREKYLISLCFMAWFYCSLGSFSICDGSENVTFKMNWSFFRLCRVYSNFLKMSNAGKFPWSWFLGDRLVSATQATI